MTHSEKFIQTAREYWTPNRIQSLRDNLNPENHTGYYVDSNDFLGALDWIEILMEDATTLNQRIAELEKKNEWIPASTEPDIEECISEYALFGFTGNEEIIYSCQYWCRCIFDDAEFFGVVSYNFDYGHWELFVDSEKIPIKVIAWRPLPPPPESEEK